MIVMCASYSEVVKSSRTRNFRTFDALGIVIQWPSAVAYYPSGNADVGVAWDAKGSGLLIPDMVEDDGTDHILDPEWLMEKWEATATKRDTLTTADSSHAKRFLDRLGQSEVFLMSVKDVGTGTVLAAVFDTRGYNQAVAPVAETCN